MTELILALDVLTREEALEIAEETYPYLDAIKLGYPLVLGAGLSVARELSQFDLPLIADFKVADIPNTNRLIAEHVFESGFSAIIAHGFAGSDSLKAIVEATENAGGECYVVAEMSHPGALEFLSGETAEKIAQMAVDCGTDGIIAPATRPERVKALRSIIKDKKILSPGVGAQGGDAREIAPLIDGMIVGRSIYNSENPAKEAEKFAFVRR
ncbi:orotidine-5'-phosphate decarboxylase [Methanomicrobium antiquum]|uniref:Orotidine 5'-phosphate decarboxylase n=1 Tax=Methanomicrobium antiquum TaxID=487686 RepID=A0AAF0JLW2_9EURY|nr:orotidine-5'-phosphate decarboxylase [Methanomicrobium antiquum]MDD3978047.1 orotidine-5'-phosphate decarboxylase [Methanomicrobium sp.]WFN36507.1 orotidine-5'-phosphate decarboxylase [Methanomicrobium antiquum]